MNDFPNRKLIRLKNYDYSKSGYYFITLCTYQRQNLFGNIKNGEIQLNESGRIVEFTWQDLINHNNVKLHEYVIMPNHFHGIIEIYESEGEKCKIPEIVRQFKSFSSKRINEYLKMNGYIPFEQGKLWQKSYFEHIIRDKKDYIEKAEYILNNPLKKEIMQKRAFPENML